MNKYRYIILLFVFTQMVALAQSRYYSNDFGDCLILQNDSIFLKLSNFDAFDSYSVFLGKGTLSSIRYNKAHEILYLQTNVFDNYSYEVELNETDYCYQSSIELQRYDGYPIEFAYVTLLGNNDNLLSQVWTDKNGTISFEDKIASRCTKIIVKDIGMDMVIDSGPKCGYKMVIKCSISYPYIKIKKHKLIVLKNSLGLNVVYNKKSHIMTKNENAPSTLLSCIH